MRKKRFYTTFTKLTISFVGFGLVPLLILSILFFQRYIGIMQETSVNNYSQISGYFARNVGDVLDGADEAAGALYDYQTPNGESLASVLKKADIPDSERTLQVTDALRSVMMQSEYISSARFVDYKGNIYSIYHDQGKTLRNDAALYTSMKIFNGKEIRDMKLLGTTQESNICVNSDDFVFVLVRNFMDISTIDKAYTDALGTLFLDIDVQVIEELVKKMNLSKGEFYVYNRGSGQYLYSEKESDYLEGNHPLADYEQYLEGDAGYERGGGCWVFFQRIGNTEAYTVLKLYSREIVGDFYQSRTVMSLLLSFSCAFLLIIYMAFSNRMSAPTRRLKEAMEQVEKGSLDVRVDLNTRDEMEYVADGFNKMVEKLNDYINQVYVAQICQKDAELNALKMQIQPHYLYNTLDVIRMTALEENDEKTAELLECLAHQLRYVMGEHNERICLKDELEVIREYFVIMKTRYEGRIMLHMNVKSEDLTLIVPKMLLQPVVENAVKHGLREKEGRGTVEISVFRQESYLEIVVMDDGVGMDEERVKQMQEALDRPKAGKTDRNGGVSIGMKNVYDRIKLNCGSEYGFTIESVIGMGTIVTYYLPIWEEFGDDVESGDCR